MNRLTSLIFAALLLVPLAALHASYVTNLRCENLTDPVGVDVANPRLSWRMEGATPFSPPSSLRRLLR
jgi:hypothetical protein